MRIFGPINMGFCRAFNLLLGMSVYELGVLEHFPVIAIPLIYIAAITGIDQELYDAVKVDGANRIQAIRHVTVPGIMPTYITLFILGISGILGAGGFDQPFMYMNPLVSRNLMNLSIYTYQLGIILNQYSFSIAFGITNSFLSLLLLSLANVLAKRVRGTSIF
jgi:putative aldouronate transport system permease protein